MVVGNEADRGRIILKTANLLSVARAVSSVEIFNTAVASDRMYDFKRPFQRAIVG